MREFEVVTTVPGYLGQIRQVASNVEKYRLLLDDILEDGVHLTSVTASVTSALSTVGVPALSADDRNAVIALTTTATEEDFSMTVTIVTTDGQTLHFLLSVEVRAPLS